MTEPLATIVANVLDQHQRDGTRLMQILREVQEAHGWLPPAAITAIAAGISWPRAKVESTAGFYSFFHTQPLGRYRVLWSDNITDRMLGNMALMDAMCKKLWLEPGRYLVNPAVNLLLQVRDVKGPQIAITDGGTNLLG